MTSSEKQRAARIAKANGTKVGLAARVAAMRHKGK